MDLPGILALMLPALGLGAAHALAPDHVMTVLALTDGGARRDGLRQALYWAGGHGLALIAAALAMIVMGQLLPGRWLVVAEWTAALALVVMGANLLIRAGWLPSLHVHAPFGRHLHLPVAGTFFARPHEHGALALGLLHGLAGSATVLATLTSAVQFSPGLALAAVAAFVLGVLVTMAIFGHGCGVFLAGGNRDAKPARRVTGAIGTGTIAAALYMLGGLI